MGPLLNLSSIAPLQIWVNEPTQNNFIALPNASGVFVVQALAPLFIDSTGTVALDQSQIVQVGQLAAGSIGRTFGEIPYLSLAATAGRHKLPDHPAPPHACSLPMPKSLVQAECLVSQC